MLPDRFVLLYALTPAPTLAICAKLLHPAPEQRSIWKPYSLSELSFQKRLIWLLEAAVADRLLGATGGEDGVTGVE